MRMRSADVLVAAYELAKVEQHTDYPTLTIDDILRLEKQVHAAAPTHHASPPPEARSSAHG